MVKDKTMPKWATPERQARLVALFQSSGGFCVFGHKNCNIPHHHYGIFIDDIIYEWKQSDREQRQAEWLAERKVIHSLGEKRNPLRGQFSAISQEIWGDKKPLYYIENLGMSGLILKPFAKVRIPSSYTHLYVDLGNMLKKVGKVRRRKAIRYHKPLPVTIDTEIAKAVQKAIKHYYEH